MKKSVGFLLSILIVIIGCNSVAQAGGADIFYDVSRVVGDDTLSLRAQGSSTSRLLGHIPANARF